VYVRIEASPCIFTRALPPDTVLPLPIAHGEGRFVGERNRLAALARGGQVPLRYARPSGEVAEGFPDNPNGSEAAAAAVCDGRGNVMALMPHPERAQELGTLSRAIAGPWSEARERWTESGQGSTDGPGLVIFRGLAHYMKEA
jgi:phosphoribosylformylglycinamidine synthase